MPRKTTSLAAAVAALAVAAPAAHATDASLRQTIRKQDAKTKPDAKAFAQAAAHFAQSGDSNSLRSATAKLFTDVKQTRSAVASQKASTAKVAKGRVLYLASLTRMGRGLQSFDTAIVELQKGRKSKAKKLAVRADRQISAANASGTRAEKMIGVKS
jgi:hypothetical protein